MGCIPTPQLFWKENTDHFCIPSMCPGFKVSTFNTGTILTQSLVSPALAKPFLTILATLSHNAIPLVMPCCLQIWMEIFRFSPIFVLYIPPTQWTPSLNISRLATPSYLLPQLLLWHSPMDGAWASNDITVYAISWHNISSSPDNHCAIVLDLNLVDCIGEPQDSVVWSLVGILIVLSQSPL